MLLLLWCLWLLLSPSMVMVVVMMVAVVVTMMSMVTAVMTFFYTGGIGNKITVFALDSAKFPAWFACGDWRARRRGRC